ncbi:MULTISPECIES: ABC transporter permease [unclassified Gordonia (in: high G+C Gram-positive bacteria)]|uniref:ABC transporter permease n=1 Tax=unclassified Gordonia (in: high G+C Gram-positive bacteria) TaxID=2657482 RepID=UPI001FFE7E0C|nr:MULTISPECIES: ABC transporter permease [unclassified Gordonia (in: high G+C Gram-positive bacteria)]UQE76423.1 ABC transporter permease [Gordonia sp. PP30]
MTDLSSTVIHIGPALGVALVLLTVVAAVVNRLSGSGEGAATVWSVARAVVQLGILAALIALVMHRLWASALFMVVMGVVAGTTSARRIARHDRRDVRRRVRETACCVVAVAVPALVIVAVLIPAGVLPPNGLAVIPTAGIMFGGAMNTASLAGRRALDELRLRAGEVEAALSLGFSPRDARSEICRPAAASALMPALDQTKSVGLVTIPGSFVGMILGGASPLVAGIMQLFVLIGILAVSSIAMALTVEFVARGELA